MATILGLLSLSAYNVVQMIVDYGGWRMNIASILMGNVCKYAFFAFAYQDGHQGGEDPSEPQET